MSSLQGIPTLEIVQTALLASVVFLSFMIGEAVLARRQRRAPVRRRKRE